MVSYLKIINKTKKDLSSPEITLKASSFLNIYIEGNTNQTNTNFTTGYFSFVYYNRMIYMFITKYYNEVKFEVKEDNIVKFVDRFVFWDYCTDVYYAINNGTYSLISHYDVDFEKIPTNNSKTLVYSDYEKKFLPVLVGGDGGTTDHLKLLNIGKYTHVEIDDHIENNFNPHDVTKNQVGLGNVDNTSDIDKPISTSVQLELDKLYNPTEDGKKYVPANGTTNNGNILTSTEEEGVYEWRSPSSLSQIDDDNVLVDNTDLEFLLGDNLSTILSEIDHEITNKIAFGEYSTNDVIEEPNGDLYTCKEDKDGNWYVRYIVENEDGDIFIQHATRFNNPSIITYTEAYNNYLYLTYTDISGAV